VKNIVGRIGKQERAGSRAMGRKKKREEEKR